MFDIRYLHFLNFFLDLATLQRGQRPTFVCKTKGKIINGDKS
ncbi:hypothetical protein D1AOALGA4SA_8347 [Olavius algarvensis Delta 1 endosymbiont]|nr:hypothetical protein D1AOALGA4SA_8347 [Olavius algarvensis Delta 1 endosymbiont]